MRWLHTRKNKEQFLGFHAETVQPCPWSIYPYMHTVYAAAYTNSSGVSCILYVLFAGISLLSMFLLCRGAFAYVQQLRPSIWPILHINVDFLCKKPLSLKSINTGAENSKTRKIILFYPFLFPCTHICIMEQFYWNFDSQKEPCNAVSMGVHFFGQPCSKCAGSQEGGEEVGCVLCVLAATIACTAWLTAYECTRNCQLTSMFACSTILYASIKGRSPLSALSWSGDSAVIHK